MLQSETLTKTSDNSGVFLIKFIQTLKNKKRIAKLGDFFVGSIQQFKSTKMKKNFLKKKALVCSLIVQTKSWFFRKDGQKIRFLKNSVVVFDKQQNNLLGSRLSCAVCKEFHEKKLLKFLSLTTQFI
uniref:Ribosomal protein L14 n=1 Tax=Aureoumbra lagunensis TaxID=44058 RepID=A0A7U0QFT9_9STRA|nr:ribosomal protein L14 [Aureoumbra lagunensis]QQW50394.1 ribosomal protein L14 [Aureoumbra lagunensis]